MRTFFLHTPHDIHNLHELQNEWRMKRIGGGITVSTIMGDAAADYIPARVPGSVYNDLLSHKKMADPFWRDNEDGAFALMEHDFEYKCVFVLLGE